MLPLEARADLRLEGWQGEPGNNFALGDKGRYRTNVWDCAGITGIGK